MFDGAEVHRLFGRCVFLYCGGNVDGSFPLLPLNVGFVPVGDVDLLVRGFPDFPLVGGGGKLVPSLGFSRVIIRRHHCAVGNGNRDVVADGQGSAFRLRLRLLKNDDILIIEFHHQRLNCDVVGLVEATTVGDKVSEKLYVRHGRVEIGGALELPVPCLAQHMHDELDTPLVGGIVHRAIGNVCVVIGFRFADFGGCCILRYAIVVYIFLWGGRRTWRRIVWCSGVPRR